MKNYIQNGDVVTVTAPVGGVVSGQGLLVGHLFGIVAKDAAEGESVEMALTGVYELPKAANAVLTQGGRVSWDAANSQIVAPATGMVPVGATLLAAGNSTIIARVRLNGITTVAA